MCALARRGPGYAPDPKPYPTDFDRTPLLSGPEEVELAARIARGDGAARERMIRANLRLVVMIARNFTGRGLDLEDLVGEGDVGLIVAVERFDARFEVRFSTYACAWIKQSIREALGNTGATIRLPMHAFLLLGKWRRTALRLGQSLGREPCFDEVAGAMDLPAGKRRIIEQALRAQHPSDVGDLSAEPAARPVDPHSGPEQAEGREDLRHRLGRLDATERSIIALRFGLEGGAPMTLKEVGVELGFTREWIRKLELRALAKLR